MTKLDLQKELLEKVKPGTKPSDIKRQNIKPKSDKDDGYSSGEEEKKNIPTAPPLPNQDLQNQITSLKKQLQTYKDFKEADLKIKEKYKEKIKELEGIIKGIYPDYPIIMEEEKPYNVKKYIGELEDKITEQDKTIQDLKKTAKSKGEVKGDPIETFTCYHWRKQQELSLLVLELPEGKLCQPCWTILRKKTKEAVKPTPTNFTCVACEEKKQEIPNYKKVEISYKPHLIKGKEYPVCSTCSPHVKEYNEDENRELEPGE